uniref:Calmodulin n=1 Tax=Chromera velia CCMP2878 TaxID=1169474 RepID=A0A0G4GCZ2_9ALVE|eukprot:Cvel_21319.t1-p1 / transcript=Cvel_21319.t1 / gene=Cvel_21319 / organism=Chromera_velia_CCMP2878 / gene_product=Calmodulin, putative / transcript_product=Calmodulin, putative / location=Cvel_scaffold1988:2282-5203(-) / protein_length=205 / sequence_SO=supercontig / SO=protein_coding / is_pseudo=false
MSKPVRKPDMNPEGVALVREHADTFKYNFELMDEDNDGKITHEQAAILFRAFGQNPHDHEITKKLKDAPPMLEFVHFREFFQRHYDTPTGPDELEEALKVFTKGDGKINVQELRQALQREQLTPEEMERLLKLGNFEPGPTGGTLDSRVLAQKLCEGPSEADLEYFVDVAAADAKGEKNREGGGGNATGGSVEEEDDTAGSKDGD